MCRTAGGDAISKVRRLVPQAFVEAEDVLAPPKSAVIGEDMRRDGLGKFSTGVAAVNATGVSQPGKFRVIAQDLPGDPRQKIRPGWWSEEIAVISHHRFRPIRVESNGQARSEERRVGKECRYQVA